jgi:hypothetical protein
LPSGTGPPLAAELLRDRLEEADEVAARGAVVDAAGAGGDRAPRRGWGAGPEQGSVRAGRRLSSADDAITIASS